MSTKRIVALFVIFITSITFVLTFQRLRINDKDVVSADISWRYSSVKMRSLGSFFVWTWLSQRIELSEPNIMAIKFRNALFSRLAPASHTHYHHHREKSYRNAGLFDEVSAQCVHVPYSVIMGFFLNYFQWIQQIQWIMTKSKNGMVTRGITQSATDALPFTVIECAFTLLPLVRYPLWLTTVNRYYPRDSNGNIVVYHYIWECICCWIWSVSGNHTTFGFSVDSLNSANSVKVI